MDQKDINLKGEAQLGFSSLSTILKNHTIRHVLKGKVDHFDELSKEQQILIVTGLARYIDILGAADAEDIDINDAKLVSEMALKRLELKASPEFYPLMNSNDFVEMYSSDLVPIYKSPNFWGTSSYSIEDLYTRPYATMYSRDEFSEAALYKAAVRIFTGESEFIENPVPVHIGKEINGPVEYRMGIKAISSLKDENGILVGAIITSKIDILVGPSYPTDLFLSENEGDDGEASEEGAVVIPFSTKNS